MAFQAIFNESWTDGFFEEIGPGLHPLRMVGRNRICLRGDNEKNESEAVEQFRHTSGMLS